MDQSGRRTDVTCGEAAGVPEKGRVWDQGGDKEEEDKRGDPGGDAVGTYSVPSVVSLRS